MERHDFKSTARIRPYQIVFWTGLVIFFLSLLFLEDNLISLGIAITTNILALVALFLEVRNEKKPYLSRVRKTFVLLGISLTALILFAVFWA
jgi:DMSO/TMAO reductase YedYZ heme-binding membrane subunit